jgi:hypothetical protein
MITWKRERYSLPGDADMIVYSGSAPVNVSYEVHSRREMGATRRTFRAYRIVDQYTRHPAAEGGECASFGQAQAQCEKDLIDVMRDRGLRPIVMPPRPIIERVYASTPDGYRWEHRAWRVYEIDVPIADLFEVAGDGDMVACPCEVFAVATYGMTLGSLREQAEEHTKSKHGRL